MGRWSSAKPTVTPVKRPARIGEGDGPASQIISLPTGEKVIIPLAVWSQMMGAALDGLGLRAAADAGNRQTKTHVGIMLETLCKMDARFRSVEGVKGLFESWSRMRPETIPKADWLIEHASKLLSGKLRYPDEAGNEQTVPTIGRSSARSDEPTTKRGVQQGAGSSEGANPIGLGKAARIGRKEAKELFKDWVH
jgi:hypothetical protein